MSSTHTYTCSLCATFDLGPCSHEPYVHTIPDDVIHHHGVSAFAGKHHTPETRQLISANLVPWHKGRKVQWTPEHIEKNRNNLIALNKRRAGRKLSEETIDKIKTKRAKQVVRKGWTHSEETKAKIRAKRALQTNVRNQYSSPPKSP